MVEGTGSLGQSILNNIARQAQQNFKLADTDKSGGLDKNEVQVRAEKTGQGQKVIDSFESIDTDGNGELTQTELQSFRQAQGGRNPEQLLNQLQNIFERSGINTGSIVDFLSNQASKDNSLNSLLRDTTNLDALVESRINEIFTSAGITGSTTEPGDLTSQISTFI
ncbi:MAG: EF-hand domain-containing protein [Nitrospinaceae bacterium]|nr:EF-hand domain-containing protein [Nitrospinaceae bacterium]